MALIFVGVFLFLRCRSSQYESWYPTASANVAHALKLGTVISVRKVAIDGQTTNAGVYGGMGAGSAVGAAGIRA